MKKPRARWWGVVAGNIHRHRASSRPQNERSRRNSSWVMCAFASKPWWWDWCCYRQWSHYFSPFFEKPLFLLVASFYAFRFCYPLAQSLCVRARARARVNLYVWRLLGCLIGLNPYQNQNGPGTSVLTKMGCLLYQLPKPNCRLLETG